MVGDCVGSSADIFESIAAEIIAAMILAGTLAQEAKLSYPAAFVSFPLVVHAFDVIVSSLGILSLGDGSQRSMMSWVAGTAAGADVDPLRVMKRGYLLSLSCAAVVFAGLTRWLLYEPTQPSAWLHYYGCGLVGMLTSYVFILSTQYYTDYQFEPVRSIAAASTTGHGTNIIAGVAVGMRSTAIPVLMVSVAVITAYTLGRTSGIGHGVNAGLFGTAVATMGMLSSAGYVLAMNNYGPIADNAGEWPPRRRWWDLHASHHAPHPPPPSALLVPCAGGIAEMSQQPEAVREATDRLDAAGNVTKAITKGYSIGSAALACFLLFGALMDEMSAFAGRPFRSGAARDHPAAAPLRTPSPPPVPRAVDIATPEVLVGGLLGVMMVFYFVGLSVAAVGRTAQHVVEEVRRQLREKPEIMEWKAKPNYYACVKLVTAAALREMRLPGLLTVAMPVSVGIVFRVFGELTGRPLLGCVHTGTGEGEKEGGGMFVPSACARDPRR
jgi:H+-translocating diphosphatase